MIISESLLKQIIREETQIVLQESKAIYNLLKALFKKSAKKKGAIKGTSRLTSKGKENLKALERASEVLANSPNQDAVKLALKYKNGKRLVQLAKNEIAEKAARTAKIPITGQNYRNVIDDILKGTGPNAREVSAALGKDGRKRLERMLRILQQLENFTKDDVKKNKSKLASLLKLAVVALGTLESLNYLEMGPPLARNLYVLLRNFLIGFLRGTLGSIPYFNETIKWGSDGIGKIKKKIVDYYRVAWNTMAPKQKFCKKLDGTLSTKKLNRMKLSQGDKNNIEYCISKSNDGPGIDLKKLKIKKK